MIMNELNREQISALKDDELDSGTSLVLNALQENHEFRQAWNNYHLIGEALRGNLPEHVDIKLAERVSRIVNNEPAIIARQKTLPAVFKPVIGFAIAASVATIAILGVRQVSTGPTATPNEIIASNPPETVKYPVATVSTSPDKGYEVHEFKKPVGAESRLNRYLVNYNEYRTNAGVQGMLPYVRIVAHEVEE
jgi:sigma-E factor negative regulatory protein RseA